MSQFVLASASPRRRDLLEAAGYDFSIIPAQVDESLAEGVALEQAIAQIAYRKAQAVAEELSPTTLPIVACDTLVVLGEQVLGKPEGKEDACRMLRQLTGNTHRVISGVCVLFPGEEPVLFSESTLVTFRDLSQDEIEAYVATGEPLDKAGAYAIQGGAAAFVDSYDGDWDNIVGLPVTPLAHELAQRGIIPSREVG